MKTSCFDWHSLASPWREVGRAPIEPGVEGEIRLPLQTSPIRKTEALLLHLGNLQVNLSPGIPFGLKHLHER